MTISAELRNHIRAKYHFACGYCGVNEVWAGGELEIDHFQPSSQGGSDEPENLVYACTSCNRFKGSYWPTTNAPQSLRLLLPARDDLSLHIGEMTDGRLTGLTPRGWFHIGWLHLNRPQLIALRQLKRNETILSEALKQAEITHQQLQRRILDLQEENNHLRMIITSLI